MPQGIINVRNTLRGKKFELPTPHKAYTPKSWHSAGVVAPNGVSPVNPSSWFAAPKIPVD